jgi:hypothetical protein
MARIPLIKPEKLSDPAIAEIFQWVTQVEGAVPNHFFVEMNFPELFKAKLATTQVLWQMGELTLPEVQHVGILVSAGTVAHLAFQIKHDAVAALRAAGLSDKGIVQLIHLVSDFGSYNRLNLALQTDYDYRDMWRALAFGWNRQSGEPPGDDTRGVNKPASPDGSPPQPTG